MENKWTSLTECLPEKGADVLLQSDEWISRFNLKGVRIGFLGFNDVIFTAVWIDYRETYVTESIGIESEFIKQIKWKLIE